MKSFIHLAAASAAISGFAAPAAAQYAPQAYPQYQQSYPQQQAYPGYGQPGYGYSQGYGQTNPVGQIIDQLLGNRYTVTDRTAVSQCARAAMDQAAAGAGAGYGNGYANNGYGQRYGGYNNAAAMRVTSITAVERRSNGLRVSGTMSSESGYGGHNSYQNGNRNGAYADNVTFRCNVDYRGEVTNIRIGGNSRYRR